VNGNEFTVLTQGKRHETTGNITILSAASIQRQKKRSVCKQIRTF